MTIAALCDVDSQVLAKNVQELDKKNLKVTTYTDYRNLLENPARAGLPASATAKGRDAPTAARGKLLNRDDATKFIAPRMRPIRPPHDRAPPRQLRFKLQPPPA